MPVEAGLETRAKRASLVIKPASTGTGPDWGARELYRTELVAKPASTGTGPDWGARELYRTELVAKPASTGAGPDGEQILDGRAKADHLQCRRSVEKFLSPSRFSGR